MANNSGSIETAPDNTVLNTESTIMVSVEVAYASETQQAVLRCEVPKGTTVRQAFVQSGIERHIDALSINTLAAIPLGIFSRPVRDPSAQRVEGGERIEGYRPIKCDPKQMRRQRAAKRSRGKSS